MARYRYVRLRSAACLYAAILAAALLSHDVTASPAVLSPLDALDLFSQGAPLRFDVSSGACSVDNGQWPLFSFGGTIASGFVSYYDDQCWVFSFGINKLLNGSMFNTTDLVRVEAQAFVYDTGRVIFQLSALNSQGKQLSAGEITCNTTTNSTRGVRLTTEATPGVALYSYSDVVQALKGGYSLSFAVNMDGCNNTAGLPFTKRLPSLSPRHPGLDRRASGRGGGYFSLVGQISDYYLDPAGSLHFMQATPNVGVVELVDVMVFPTNRTKVYMGNTPSFQPMGAGETGLEFPLGSLSVQWSGYDCVLSASGTFRVYQR